jgi:prepilin-type N-terminal cleavage/methylation domain-containing protein
MTGRLRDERGVTLIEMLVAMVLTGIVMVGVVNIFISGARSGADANTRLEAQQGVRLALDRLEFEGRCATSAALVSGGAGVYFQLPAWCSHASGDVTWCVDSGVLTRFTANSCTGTGQIFVRDVTSDTPFSIPATASGDLPVLLVDVSVDPGSGASTAATLTDTITLRNATRAS